MRACCASCVKAIRSAFSRLRPCYSEGPEAFSQPEERRNEPTICLFTDGALVVLSVFKLLLQLRRHDEALAQGGGTLHVVYPDPRMDKKVLRLLERLGGTAM